MEQLVILIIIGLISLVNWVMQKAAEKREAAKLERVEKREAQRNIYTQRTPSPRPRTAPRAPAQDPFKELMDALGLPSDAVPPPVAPRQPEIVEEEFASVEETAPPPLPKPPRIKFIEPRMAAVRRPDEKTTQLASAFAAAETPAPAKVHHGTVRSLLADRTSKRHAMILAEILGPPRGLATAATWPGRS